VRLADGPGRVEQHRGRARLPSGRELVGLRRRHVALRPRRRRDQREPDHALRRRLLLERLHIAGLVVLAYVRTIVIRPLEDDELAALIGEAHALAGRGGEGEARRAIADLGDGDRPRGRRGEEVARSDGGQPCERRAREKRATGEAVRRHELSFGFSAPRPGGVPAPRRPAARTTGFRRSYLVDRVDDRTFGQDLW